MREASALTLPELLSTVAQRGCPITRAQLHRWRKFGLLKTPALEAGGRHGRTAYYPAGVVSHLLAIDLLLKKSRDLDAVRWQLFLGGFDVPPASLRKQLALHTQALVDRRHTLLASETDDAVGDVVASVVAKGGKRVASRPLDKLIRKRVRGRTFDFTMTALRVVSGLASPQDDESNLQVFARAVGDQPELPLPTETVPLLKSLFNPEGMAAVLVSTSDETIAIARREFLFDVLPLLQAIVDQLPEVAATMALDKAADPFWPDPHLFLLWLLHREHPHAKPLIDHLRTELSLGIVGAVSPVHP